MNYEKGRLLDEHKELQILVQRLEHLEDKTLADETANEMVTAITSKFLMHLISENTELRKKFLPKEVYDSYAEHNKRLVMEVVEISHDTSVPNNLRVPVIVTLMDKLLGEHVAHPAHALL